VNRFGFSSPDLDRSVDGYLSALDRSERIQQLAQAERLAMEQVAAIPTYWTAVITAHAASLKGVKANLVPEAGAGSIWSYEWEY